MALQFVEGFGAYETGVAHAIGEAVDPKLIWDWWTSNLTMTSLVSGVNGTRNYMTMPSDSHCEKFLPTRLNRLILGFRIYRTSSANNLLCVFIGEGQFGRFGIRTDGRLVYTLSSYMDDGSQKLLSDDPIPVNGWVYLEIDVTFHETAGAVAFWINGQASGSVTGIDTTKSSTTGASYCGKLIVGGYSGDVHDAWQSTNRITDVYLDSNTRRGPLEVWYQAADSLGNAVDFTPLSSTNHAMVDELGADNDTTYNESTVVTDQDAIAHSDTLEDDPLAIQPVIFARKEGNGEAAVKVGVRSSTTENLDTVERPLAPAYAGRVGLIYEDDPHTAIAWVAANADAAETLYNHSS